MPEVLAFEQKRSACIEDVVEFLGRKKNHIKALIPGHVEESRMRMIAYQAVQRQPRFLECEPSTRVLSLLESFRLGLELGSTLGEACILPFKDRRRNCLTATFSPMYKGLGKLAYNSGKVRFMTMATAHTGDTFEYEMGTSAILRHKKDPAVVRTEMNLEWAYTLIWLPNRDSPIFSEPLSKAEIDAVRNRAPGKNGEGWTNFYAAMAGKTSAKRSLKLAPFSASLSHAIGLDDLVEAGKISDHVDALQDVWEVPVDMVTDRRALPPASEDHHPSDAHLRALHSYRRQWQDAKGTTYDDFSALTESVLDGQRDPCPVLPDDKNERRRTQDEWGKKAGAHAVSAVIDRLKELLEIETIE